MNRIEAIRCQIGAVAEHITGREGYSLASLCRVRDAILDAHDRIAGEIIKREKAPSVRGLLADIGKPEGGAA